MTLLRRLARRLADWLHNWSDERPDANDDATKATNSTDEPPEDASPEDASPEDDGRSTAEQITTALSVLLIAILAGALLYEGYATGQADPATLEVTVLREKIEQRGDAFYVPVEIVNDGDETVEEVTVNIELRDGDAVVDEAETVIATLGEAETVTAVLVVAEDPAGLTIEAGVVTFQVAED